MTDNTIAAPITTTFIDTDARYNAIIAAPDDATRRRRFTEGFIQPWSQMMTMTIGHLGGESDDPLAGARAWHWLLPDDLTTEPEALRQLKAANAWVKGGEAMSKSAAAFAPFTDRIPFDHIDGWLVLADPATSDPVMRGATGAVDWMNPRFVIQIDTPTDNNLAHLQGMIVHEINHLVRLKVYPWDMMNTSVADYIILEGVAEAFAKDLFGAPSVTFMLDLTDDDLASAKAILRDGLDKTGFGLIRSYLFGDYWADKLNLPKVGMPTYGGYALGYRVVQAYMDRTGKSAAEATFVAADEIVRESGYFD